MGGCGSIWAILMQSYRTVSISELTPGSVLLVPVFDQKLTKLLHSGLKVDERLISRLKERGINEFHVESSVKQVVAGGEKSTSSTLKKLSQFSDAAFAEQSSIFAHQQWCSRQRFGAATNVALRISAAMNKKRNFAA